MQFFHAPSLAGPTKTNIAADAATPRWRCRDEDTGRETTIWFDRAGYFHSVPADPTTGPFAALAATYTEQATA